GTVRHETEHLVSELLQCRWLFLAGVPAVLQEMMMQVDLHRARLRARPTQRGGSAEMLPVLQPAQMRRDDAADRSAIRGAVRVTAHVAEDGAHIQARPATDAVQGIALFRIGEQQAATI